MTREQHVESLSEELRRVFPEWNDEAVQTCARRLVENEEVIEFQRAVEADLAALPVVRSIA